MRMTRFCSLFVLTAFALQAGAANMDMSNISELYDLIDQADHQDFLGLIEKANSCTRALEFSCAELQLGKAAKLTSGARDKQIVADARLELASARVAEQARVEAERMRQLALEGERRRAEQAEAERRASADTEDDGPSAASMFLQFGALVTKNYVANKAAVNALRPRGLPLADLSVTQQKSSSTKAVASAARKPAEAKGSAHLTNAKPASTSYAAAITSNNLAQPNTKRPSTGSITAPDKLAVMNRLIAGAQPTTQGAIGVPRSQEIWQDRYSNTVNSTGVTKTYEKHDGDIPGDVMESRMGSREVAIAMWASQGAKNVQYTGCGTCGVGSVVRVVVDFGYIIDTHEYKRIK